jgi:hypothetical protein
MLKVMSCSLCGKMYRIGEFRKIINVIPDLDQMDGQEPKDMVARMPVCKSCYTILKSGKAIDRRHPEESIDDKVREIIEEEMPID